MRYEIFFLFLLLSTIFNLHQVLATDKILITKSFTMNEVIFDGKWSFYTEWKKSSLDTLSYGDGTTIQLRTAHQGNFVYIFVDDVNTNLWTKGSDRATICFDTDNSKSKIADSNDYCFITNLSDTNPITLQGSSPLAFTNHFKTIANPDGFIGIASISDENDRYTKNPHPNYEFRIPTDVIGRSSNYGFYISIYHAQGNKIYSWPQDIFTSTPLEIPNPDKWGDLVSPDASLPEFPWPMIPLLASIITTIWFTRKHNSLRQT